MRVAADPSLSGVRREAAVGSGPISIIKKTFDIYA